MRDKLLLIALGGAAGSVLRYLVAGWVQRAAGGVFPFGTLAVNVAGCFAIGLLNPLFLGPFLIRPELRVAILVGLLGGFTTFSTYGWETLSLGHDGEWLAAAGNLLLHNVLGLAAAWGGYQLARGVFGT
ncbi:MAG TPA: fluoride efflux transporter CrcB [Thermoanaerobaculia bacterium]